MSNTCPFCNEKLLFSYGNLYCKNIVINDSVEYSRSERSIVCRSKKYKIIYFVPSQTIVFSKYRESSMKYYENMFDEDFCFDLKSSNFHTLSSVDKTFEHYNKMRMFS